MGVPHLFSFTPGYIDQLIQPLSIFLQWLQVPAYKPGFWHLFGAYPTPMTAGVLSSWGGWYSGIPMKPQWKLGRLRHTSTWTCLRVPHPRTLNKFDRSFFLGPGWKGERFRLGRAIVFGNFFVLGGSYWHIWCAAIKSDLLGRWMQRVHSHPHDLFCWLNLLPIDATY